MSFLRKLLIITIMQCCILLCYAQSASRQQGKTQSQGPSPVVIQGSAPFAAGKNIRLIGFQDLLSYRSHVIAEDAIANDGTFTLSYQTKQVELVQLAINTSKAEFYITPGKTYHLKIDMDPALFDLLDPMAYGGYLQISCTDPMDTNDVNAKVSFFERYTDDVIDYFSPNIIGDMTKAQFDSIDSVLHARFDIRYVPTNFYKSYQYYSFAYLERILLQKNYDSLYRKYLDNEYVLYDNPAYMNFFNTFYDHYFTKSSKISTLELRKCINEEGTLLSLFNLVGKDPLLVNERIRELAIIKNLGQLYEAEEYNKANVRKLLSQIAQTSNIEEHRIMARTMLTSLQEFESGADVVLPHFIEANGADFDLESLKGKWVYIQLFNTSCSDCIREMVIVKNLKEKYGDKIEFVSLSLDFNFGHFIQFLEQYPQFDWHFVHFNNQFAWLEQMQITTLPDNILISPDGKLSQRYAPDISSELSLFLARLFDGERNNETTPLDTHGVRK